MQQKRILLVLYLKYVLDKIFLKFSAKKFLCVLGYILNKVNRGIVEKPDAVGAHYCPGR